MIDQLDYQLIASVQQGLPITPRPYAAIAEQLGMGEQELIERLKRLKDQGLFKRWGVVVKHRQLGYSANAMIVLDVPDQRVVEIGSIISRQSIISLCYQRPRQGKIWPYNLYCMIHGKCRDTVLRQWLELVEICGFSGFACEIFFSRRCFKQRGAQYFQHTSASWQHSMDDIDKAIINHLQQGFPICDAPYRQIAEQLALDETSLLDRIKSLLDSGVLTRFGPMYHAGHMGGAFTLAAMKVPDERFAEIMEIVNAFPEVAHNYARNHTLNMWFVLATELPEQVQTVLKAIEEQTGLKVFNMPKVSEYYVGLQLEA